MSWVGSSAFTGGSPAFNTASASSDLHEQFSLALEEE
jgi:hypothetical protein